MNKPKTTEDIELDFLYKNKYPEIDSAKYQLLWDRFAYNIANAARELYGAVVEKEGIHHVGRVIRILGTDTLLSEEMESHRLIQRNRDATFIAVVYNLRAFEYRVKDWTHAAIALHIPREDIFEMMLTSVFLLTRPSLHEAHYLMLKSGFELWLTSFAPDVLDTKKNLESIPK